MPRPSKRKRARSSDREIFRFEIVCRKSGNDHTVQILADTDADLDMGSLFVDTYAQAIDCTTTLEFEGTVRG
jgi:hypothetical protein